jgi:hypothetical protein
LTVTKINFNEMDTNPAFAALAAVYIIALPAIEV